MYAPFDCNLSVELLLGCLDVVPNIQNKISALLEATILYLVGRTLDDGAKVREGGRREGARKIGGAGEREGGGREREKAGGGRAE